MVTLRRRVIHVFRACAKEMGLRLRDLRGSTLRQGLDGAARHRDPNKVNWDLHHALSALSQEYRTGKVTGDEIL